MVQVETYLEKKQIEVGNHGAFKSFRSASEWLIEVGYEVFYDDELSEFLEDETIRFILVAKTKKETYLAHIDTYKIQD